MPLVHSPPLTMSAGTSNSRGQSVVSATAARCAPDDWPPIYRRFGSPPKLAALRKNPGDRPTHLLGHREQAPAGVRDTGEVGDDVVRASADEHLGRRRIALGVTAKPRTAVDEDEDRRVRLGGAKKVELLDPALAIGAALGLANPGTGAGAV